MLEEVDLEHWAADGQDTPIPEAGQYRLRLWDGDGFDEKRTLSDPMPTGRQILDLFGRHPVDDHVLFMLSREKGLTAVEPAATVDIRAQGAERFFAFRSDRTWNWSIDGRRFPWGARFIPESLVRLIARVPETNALFLEKAGTPDVEIVEGAVVDLDTAGLERLYSKPREWKLNVQGVVVTLATPLVLVRDALTEAGFDPNAGWIIILKRVGQPKQPVTLTDTIDLRAPGIEKLRLTPAEINNGEGPVGLRRQFRLLEKDEAYLTRRGLIWETLIEEGRRWLIIRKMDLSAGFNHAIVDIAVDVPATYPNAEIDMFYCAPHLRLANGTIIDRTESLQTIDRVSFQRWSRHLNGRTRWNPQTDSVLTYMAVIEESLFREVGCDA